MMQKVNPLQMSSGCVDRSNGDDHASSCHRFSSCILELWCWESIRSVEPKYLNKYLVYVVQEGSRCVCVYSDLRCSQEVMCITVKFKRNYKCVQFYDDKTSKFPRVFVAWEKLPGSVIYDMMHRQGIRSFVIITVER